MSIVAALPILTLAVEYAVATLADPFVCRRSSAQFPAVAAIVAMLVVCPLIIPREQIQLRAFALSALLHEVAFGIATSHFGGYQALFFGL